MAWQFEWDLAKAEHNLVKHGIAFEEALSVFDDPFALVDYDHDHSDEEDRWIIVGLSSQRRLITVWYTERAEIIRIIGCRRASRREHQGYVRSR